MTRTIIILALLYAMPAYAEPIQIVDSVTVPVSVTVDNVAYCSFEKAVCNDNDIVVTEE